MIAGSKLSKPLEALFFRGFLLCNIGAVLFFKCALVREDHFKRITQTRGQQVEVHFPVGVLQTEQVVLLIDDGIADLIDKNPDHYFVCFSDSG